MFGRRTRDGVNDVMQKYDIPEVSKRWKLQDACWLFKIINKDRFNIPAYITDLFQFKNGPYETRNQGTIDATSRTKAGEKSLVFRLKELQKSISSELFGCETIECFRRNMLKLL